MRIDCEKCGAAYAIDDRVVTAKGVRAKCPRCGELVLVRQGPNGPVRASEPERSQRPGATPPRTMTGDAVALSSPAPARALVEPNHNHPTEQITLPLPLPESAQKTDTAACRSCEKPLTDPFDRALGVCDECRTKDIDRGDLPTDDIALGPELTPTAQMPAGGARPSAPVSSPVSREISLKNAARPQERTPTRWPFIVGGAAVGAAIAIAALLFLRPSLFGFKPEVAPLPEIPQAIRETVPKWRLGFVGLSGEAEEQLAAGRASLAEDTPSGYLDAEEAFQKALILDPSSDEAVEGYVRAVALGRGTAVDDETFDEALALIRAGRGRTHDAPGTLIAEGQLLLCRPQLASNVEGARANAERALAASKTRGLQADAELLLGRTYAQSSLALALQHFAKAAEAAPGLARVHYERAKAYEAAGDLRKAMEELNARLASNPDEPQALAALSRLFQEVGDVDAARAVYTHVLEKQPSQLNARMMLGVLAYQVEERYAEGAQMLETLAKDADRYDERQRVLLYVHLAAAKRAAGDLEGASKAVKDALSASPNEPAAQLQRLLIALARGQLHEAQESLSAVSGRLGDSALERLLSARLLFAQQQYPAAAKAYLEAAAADPRRSDAVIMAGVAYARAGARADALHALAPLLELDPTRVAPRPMTTRFFVMRGETLQGSDGAVEKLAKGSEDLTPVLFEALIDWHRGAQKDAERGFQLVTSKDAGNAIAHAYLALAAVSRADAPSAVKEGERAVEADRRKAITHYAFARALAFSGERERAVRELSEAETLSPGFLAAQLSLAELERAAKQTERARARLVRLLGMDPSYLPAKQALYVLAQ